MGDPAARATLKLPAEVPQGAVRAALRALVDAFHPELAGLAADASKGELLAGRAPGPLVYLSAGRYRRPRSAPDTVVEAVGTHGWLLSR